MKIKFLLASRLAMLGLAALLIGCASHKQNGQLLSASGFKALPATTPEQRAQLKKLQTGKITKVIRQGKTYFVYPDKEKEVLYVGQQEQFDMYQGLRLDNRLREEQMRAAQMNTQPGYAPWSAWSSTGFIEPIPSFSR